MRPRRSVDAPGSDLRRMRAAGTGWEPAVKLARSDWSPDLVDALSAVAASSRIAAKESFFSDRRCHFAHYASADTCKLPILLPRDEGWTPDRLSLERIIPGPCAESKTVRSGLVQLLEDYGFDNANEI